MTDQPTIADDDPAAWAQAVMRRQVMALEQLSEAGVRLAQGIEAAGAQAPADAALAFSRVARAVRMTALLQSRLLKDMEEARSREAHARSRRAQDAEDAAEAQAEDDARLDPAYRHKARVEAIVQRVAKAETDDEDRIERIVNEAGERLDDDDIYGDVLTRPVGELVALICRDLGLQPDWTQLAQEAWAMAEGIDPACPPGQPPGKRPGPGVHVTTPEPGGPPPFSGATRHAPP